MSKETYLTRQGYQKLKQELDYSKGTRRREIAKAIGEARAHGDISENAEYDAAKEAQAHLEKRIHQLEQKLSRVRIIEDENIPDDKVYIGSKVILEDMRSGRQLFYILVSEDEADYGQRKISTTAPVGKALLGCAIGDEVDIKVPSGILKYKVVEISRAE